MISFHHDILPLKDKLFRLALRITLNPAEAEDVVQETMMKVWNRRNSWDTIDNIETFCLTICRNLSLDKMRLMGNHALSLDAETEPTDYSHHSNPEEQVKQRSCMQLRDIEGKSYKDIATILNITEEQVKINIFRARQTIREQFKKADT